MKKLFKWILWGVGGVVVILIALGILGNLLMSPEEKAKMAEESAQRSAADAASKAESTRQQGAAKVEAARQEAASMPAVTAVELSRAYAENTVAADAKFKGKKFKVTGVVEDINTDFMGNPYLTLRGVNQFMPGQYGFSKSDNESLSQVRKGNRVTLVCTGQGDIAKMPSSKDCSFVQ